MDNYGYQTDDHERNNKQVGSQANVAYTINGYPTAQTRNNEYLVEINARSKLFKRPKFFRNLTFILFFILVLLLILLIVIMYLYTKKFNSTQICTSEECLRSAANLRLSMDMSQDPCDNFYQYTCGRWSSEHPNHGWFPSFSTFATISERILIQTEDFLLSEEADNEPKPVTQARDFFKSCMDTESIDQLGLSVLFTYLEKAELPLAPALFTKTEEELTSFKFDFLRSDAVIKKIFAMDVLIGFTVEANTFNRSENVMYIGSPGQACPLPNPLKKGIKKNDESDYAELKKKVNGNIIRFVLDIIVRNVTNEEPTLELIDEATEVLLNMTTYIDELVENYTARNSYTDPEYIKTYQNKTNEILINNIDKDYPKVYEKYIKYLFEDTNVTIDFDNDLIYLTPTDYEYLPKLLAYVLTTSDVYLELYMWWVSVFAMIINTSSEIVDYIEKQAAPFHMGGEISRSRSLDCGTLVNNFMGMAVSYGIADRTFTNGTKPKVERMLENIKEAFMEQVASLSWMDGATKKATIEKSKEMISFIGYPDWLFQNGSLEQYYEGIEIKNNTYLNNMMEFVQNYMPSKFEDLRTVNERNWSTDPITVNAFNSFPDNAINVPLAILSFPMYNLGLEVLNYGAMGTVLGHELTHGFDNTGRKHDKYGNYKQWWSNATIETFEEKIQCFIKQYDNFTVEGIEQHVQGNKTLGENLADNGGLNHAYRAFKKMEKQNRLGAKLPGFENFTNDQLFFIAFGSVWCETVDLYDLQSQIDYDEHSPNSVRVLGTLQNSPDFARAFKCPAGTKMNPNKTKCKVW